MPRNMNSSSKLAAFAMVLLMLVTGATTVMLALDHGPVLKARTFQASYNSTFNVTVIDEDGRPIGGPVGPATVRIVGNTTPPGGWPADNNGTAVIPGVWGNLTGVPYDLTVEASGFQTALKHVLAMENKTTNVTVILVGGTILGKVLTTAMPPVGIAGATVYIPSLGQRYSNKTNLLGQYIMKGIPEGRSYFVAANATGYIGVVSSVYVPITGSVDFILTSQTGSITGFVYNSETHSGLGGANVSVKVSNSVITVTTSTNGSYGFSSVPPGTYSVTADKIGFYSSTIDDVVVTRENRTTVNFNLTEKPTLLSGAVRSGTLLLVRANISLVGTTLYNLTGPDGTYEIHNITAGTYTVQASRQGYVTALFVETIGPGEEKELNINLTAVPGAILRGVVSSLVSGVKVPLVDVKVTLVTSNITQSSTSTNIAGEFAFTGLAIGNYTLLFERSDYRPMQVSDVQVTNDTASPRSFLMTPMRHGFTGFFIGFDMPHSLMILGLFLTIAILAIAVYLRIRTFQTPGSAPAVYDSDDEEDRAAAADGQGELEDKLSESMDEGRRPR